MKNYETDKVGTDYEELNSYVLSNIDTYLPEDYHGLVIGTLVHKNNGVMYHGIILEHSVIGPSNVRKTIYLENVDPESTYPEACQMLAELLVTCDSGTSAKDIPDLTQDLILSTARLYAVNGQLNFLDIAHGFEDLSVGIRCIISDDEPCQSFVLTKPFLEAYGLSEDELFQVAEVNTAASASIKSLPDVLLASEYGISVPNFMTADGFEQSLDPDLPIMFVVTNNDNTYGFASILCPAVLERLSQLFGKPDFYVFPSSVHECIAIEAPDPENLDLPAWSEMVRTINTDTVSKMDFLSNSVYHYTKETGLCLA